MRRHASPVLLLRRYNIQGSIREQLNAAGLSFTGRVAVSSPAAFRRWLDRNGLDHAEVRTALVR